jgi:hypothetical protein
LTIYNATAQRVMPHCRMLHLSEQALADAIHFMPGVVVSLAPFALLQRRGLPFQSRLSLPCLALLCLPLLLIGCSALPPQTKPAFSSLVVLGENGDAVARVLIAANACPAITVDGRTSIMQLRAGAGTLAQRSTASNSEDSKPSAFPLLTCDSAIASGSTSASVLGRTLALPRPEPKRIVVIGDTGCRLKKSGNAYQACNDSEQYPFAKIAASAANWKPDLVVHVGDFHYRENPCPDGNAGCAGSSWGYGWDAWRDDFFTPAATLLQAAPWVVVRGNHESCSRAGQGYWRFIDPRPLLAGRDCNDATDDPRGDYSAPYAVPLGIDAQLLVIDSSATRWQGFDEKNPRQRHALERYRAHYRVLEALSQRATHNIGLIHHPVLAFDAAPNAKGGITLRTGDAGLQQAWAGFDATLMPPRIQLLLSGHVHLWEQLSFSSGHPSQLVAGFSGTQEDSSPLPASLPPDAEPAPGAIVEHFSSWVGGFGYMTLERRGLQSWDVTVRDVDGDIKNTCRIEGRKSQCTLPQVQ